MDYTLDLTISDSDLQAIKAAGLYITVAKPVGGREPNVAWLVIDPFEATMIQWIEEYGLYGSTIQNIDAGTVISQYSELPPPQLNGKSYLFGVDDKTVFDKGIEPCNKDSFRIENHMSADKYQSLTFGLTQKAIIHGSEIKPSVLNAATVMAQMEVVFTPLTTVYVWLQNNYISGTVITRIASKATKVEFGAGINKQGLTFDASEGRFVSTEVKSGNNITLLTPAGLY